MHTIQAGLVLPYDVLRVEDLELKVQTVENRHERGLIRIDFYDWDFALIVDGWRPLQAVDLGPRLGANAEVFFPRVAQLH